MTTNAMAPCGAARFVCGLFFGIFDICTRFFPRIRQDLRGLPIAKKRSRVYNERYGLRPSPHGESFAWSLPQPAGIDSRHRAASFLVRRSTSNNQAMLDQIQLRKHIHTLNSAGEAARRDVIHSLKSHEAEEWAQVPPAIIRSLVTSLRQQLPKHE